MAKATYQCPSCSKTITVTDYNRSAVNKKAAYMEARGYVCFACKCKQDAERAKKRAEFMKLPALEGTEKQIAWAETIRMEFLEMDLPQIAREWLCEQTSAKLFIDNRLPHQMQQAFKMAMRKNAASN